MDIGTFLVQRVIIHQIPQARKSEKADHEIGYSFAPSPLDNAKRIYFRKRITSSLQKAFDVVRDSNQPSTVPDLMLGFYTREWLKTSETRTDVPRDRRAPVSGAGGSVLRTSRCGRRNDRNGKTPGKCLADSEA